MFTKVGCGGKDGGVSLFFSAKVAYPGKLNEEPRAAFRSPCLFDLLSYEICKYELFAPAS